MNLAPQSRPALSSLTKTGDSKTSFYHLFHFQPGLGLRPKARLLSDKWPSSRVRRDLDLS